MFSRAPAPPSGLGATPRAYEHMLATQDGAKKLLDAFWANEEERPTPNLCFYASVMEIGTARLVHGGKLSGDPDEADAAPPPPPPPPPPEPEPPAAEEGAAAAEGEAAAAGPAPADGAAAEPAAEGAEPSAEAAAETPAEEEAPPPPAAPPAAPTAKWQDPSELIAVNVCQAADLSPEACISRLFYFNATAAELGPGQVIARERAWTTHMHA